MGILLFASPCLGDENEKARRHLQRGQKLEKKGLFDEAIAQYSKSVESDPEFAKAWLRLGFLNYRMQFLEEARTGLTRALEIDSENSMALYFRGLTNQHLNNLEQSHTDLSKAAELDSENSMIYLARGKICLLQNEVREAIRDFDVAEEIMSELESETRETLGTTVRAYREASRVRREQLSGLRAEQRDRQSITFNRFGFNSPKLASFLIHKV